MDLKQEYDNKCKIFNIVCPSFDKKIDYFQLFWNIYLKNEVYLKKVC